VSGDEHHQLIEDILRVWEVERIEAGDGVAVADLKQFQRRWGASLPPELKQLYLRVNGMPIEQTDADLCRFLPLEEVVTVERSFGATDIRTPAASLLVFVDYFLGAHFIAVNVAPGSDYGSVWLVSGSDSVLKISDSVREFLVSYLNNRSALLY